MYKADALRPGPGNPGLVTIPISSFYPDNIFAMERHVGIIFVSFSFLRLRIRHVALQISENKADKHGAFTILASPLRER